MSTPSRRVSHIDRVETAAGRVEVDRLTIAYEPPSLVDLGSLEQLTMHHVSWHHDHPHGHGHGGFHHHGSI